MDKVVSTILLLFLTVVVVGVVVAKTQILIGNDQPITVNIPSGVSIYGVSDRDVPNGIDYIIPVRYIKTVDEPIWVCKASIVLLDKNRGTTRVVDVTLPYAENVQRTVFPVILTMNNVIIKDKYETGTIHILTFRNFIPTSIELYYCGPDGASRGSEVIDLPEFVLTP